MEKILTVKKVAEEYGLSLYQARNLMIRAGRINIGNSEDYPRWGSYPSKIDAYLSAQTESDFTGLDASGRLLRK